MLFGDEQKDAVIPYNGTVTINLKIIEKTDLIVIHSTNLTINGVGFDLGSATQTVIKHLVIEAKLSNMYIQKYCPFLLWATENWTWCTMLICMKLAVSSIKGKMS